MIQLSAPAISANAAKPNGIAPSASPKGAETADFAALLGLAGSTGEAPEAGVQDMAAVMTAALAGLPDGKTGKAGGKTLPVAELAAAELAGSAPAVAGKLETNEAPDEAISDKADVPIAAAISVLPLLVPPLPGTGTPAEFRAAGPDTASARAVVLPGVVSQQALAATAKPLPLQAKASPTVPAAILAAPVVTEATPQVNVTSPAPVTPQAPANAATSAPKLAAVVTVPQGVGNVSELSAPPVAANEAAPTHARFDNPAHAFERLASAGVASASTPPAVAVSPMPDAAAQMAASPIARAAAGAVAKAEEAEPQPAVTADAVKVLTKDGMELDGATLAMRSAAYQVSHLNAQPDARIANAAPAAIAPPATAEQPHDFATLVDRLSEAREGASPQVVRTALQHAEFGKISLQFRHEDAQLSVTMANADPAFTSAVQSAVATSLAGNNDQPQGERQLGQQQNTNQQQAASTGNGQGQGQQHAAQARAEQNERNFHRAQGSSARAQQSETASSDRAGTGARRSGIYA